MALNDDKKHIWYLNIGWPVSVYNERLWSNTVITHNPHSYFSPREYLCCLISNHFYMVPAFKKLGRQVDWEKD